LENLSRSKDFRTLNVFDRIALDRGDVLNFELNKGLMRRCLNFPILGTVKLSASLVKINRDRCTSMHNEHRNSTLSRRLEKTETSETASTAVASPIVEPERTAAAIATAVWKLEPFIRSHLLAAP
jgi:hypothetical protein